MGRSVRLYLIAFRAAVGAVGIALVTLLVTDGCAWADYPVPFPAVQCDSQNNRVLIRFVTVDSEPTPPTINAPVDPSTLMDTPKLPSTVVAQWNNVPYQMAGECKFKDGETVSVSVTDGVVGQGMDQGLPDEYFTLNIGKHIIYDQLLFYSAFDNPNPSFVVSAVEYNGKTLLQCAPPQQNQNGKVVSAEKCIDASNRLMPGTKFYTQAELNTWTSQQQKKELTENESPFCSQLGKDISEQSPSVKYLLQDVTYLGSNGPNRLFFSTSKIDLKNDGKPLEIVGVGINADGSDGDSQNLLWFPEDENKLNQFIDFVKTKENYDLISGNSYPSVSDYAQWRKYIINFPNPWLVDHTSDEVIEYQGKIYVFTSDDTPSSDQLIPSGIISEVMPDNSIRRICSFP